MTDTLTRDELLDLMQKVADNSPATINLNAVFATCLAVMDERDALLKKLEGRWTNEAVKAMRDELAALRAGIRAEMAATVSQLSHDRLDALLQSRVREAAGRVTESNSNAENV